MSMNILHVIILSIVEGVTEFLPISSTGHLVLTSHLLQIPQTAFLGTFEIVIQLGAILAVVVLYFKKILQDKELFLKACVGFIPTGIIGIVLYPKIKHLLASDVIPAMSLLIGGIVIILLELYFTKATKKEVNKLDKITYKQSLIIGLLQSISMVPGVSRSASSIFGGMATGLSRESAVEFAFLLAIPTMAAATGLDLVKSVKHIQSNDLFYLIIGTALSFIVALFVVRWLLKFVKNHDFTGFGIYRIAISLLYFFLFFK